jgi:hypothetical protein
MKLALINLATEIVKTGGPYIFPWLIGLLTPSPVGSIMKGIKARRARKDAARAGAITPPASSTPRSPS